MGIQVAQLSQRGRAMVRVNEYYANIRNDTLLRRACRPKSIPL